MQILVTGGAGYIGSHTLIALIEAGYTPIVVDNFSNSKPESLRRVAKITGKEILSYELDVRDRAALDAVFAKHPIDAVIHFAGLKAVGESVAKPLEYYDNNLVSTLVLLDVMRSRGVSNLVFSSSATVYGEPKQLPLTEDAPLSATNPYGRTKLIIEDMLRDLAVAQEEARSEKRVASMSQPSANAQSTPASAVPTTYPLPLIPYPLKFRSLLLRYFNPVGAHPSGLIGEDPNGIPNNLFPYITQVAVGKLPFLKVYGNDYPTPDGTGVRDYIHVMDLAAGHVAALEFLLKPSVGADLASDQALTSARRSDPEPVEGPAPSFSVPINLGTGTGYSVLDCIRAFESASGKTIPHRFAPRRPGDVPACYASPSKAKELLNWTATRDLPQMCCDAWRWQSQNPAGYP